MDLLVDIINLVVLLFVIEAWVTGRIPAALARSTTELIDERLRDLANPVNARLDDLDRRLDALDTRLDGLDRRLSGIDTRLDGLDRRLSELDTRTGQLDTRIDRVDAQVAVLNAQTSKLITDLDRRVREQLRGLDSRRRAPETDAGKTETPS